MATVGADGTAVLCLREEGRPEPPSSLEAMKNCSVESSIMAHSEVGVLLRGEPKKVVHELFLLGERLGSLKQSVRNSRLPKRTVSPRDKLLQTFIIGGDD
jgi:hypothetical protein